MPKTKVCYKRILQGIPSSIKKQIKNSDEIHSIEFILIKTTASFR